MKLEDIFEPWLPYELLDGDPQMRLLFFRGFAMYRLYEIQGTYCLLRRAEMVGPYKGGAVKLPPRLALVELRMLSATQPDLVLWLYCMRVQLQHMRLELTRRYGEDAVAAALIGAEIEPTKAAEKELQRSLLTFRRESPDRSTEDITQDGFLHAFERWRQLGREYGENYSAFTDADALPEAPKFLLQHKDEQEFWANEIGPAWRKTLHLILEKFSVVGQGKKIKSQVDNYLREKSRPPGRSIRNITTQDPEERARQREALKKRKAARYAQRIEEEIGFRVVKSADGSFEFLRDDTPAADIVANKLLAEKAYRVAYKRAGDAGVKFLNGLKAGKGKAESMKRAGIARRTGFRIIENIRELCKEPSED